jgi:hypothetical protein
MVLLDSAITELSSLVASVTLLPPYQYDHHDIVTLAYTHIKELGFFFFLRIAVAVSFSCVDLSVLELWISWTGGGVLSYSLVLGTRSIAANIVSFEPQAFKDDVFLLQVDLLLVLDMIRFGRHDEGCRRDRY